MQNRLPYFLTTRSLRFFVMWTGRLGGRERGMCSSPRWRQRYIYRNVVTERCLPYQLRSLAYHRGRRAVARRFARSYHSTTGRRDDRIHPLVLRCPFECKFSQLSTSIIRSVFQKIFWYCHTVLTAFQCMFYFWNCITI